MSRHIQEENTKTRTNRLNENEKKENRKAVTLTDKTHVLRTSVNPDSRKSNTNKHPPI